jgi:regulatory protein
MMKAGRYLARRPHSVSELRTKLAPIDDAEAVEAALIRLEELDLLDDAAFARQWIEERSTRRGHRALMSELSSKGVGREIAEQAWAETAPDELTVATELAVRYLRRVMSKPLGKQAAAIQQMLQRRGYGYEIAEQATRTVLPPEGWD